MDTVDTADIVHTVDTLDIFKTVDELPQTSRVLLAVLDIPTTATSLALPPPKSKVIKSSLVSVFVFGASITFSVMLT